jgi:hypothetical protein
MRHMDARPALPLDYAPPDERWSVGAIGEMVAGLAALTFVGFGFACLFYTIALAVRVAIAW